MDVIYRPARPEDLPECVKLFTESVTDMATRHNLPAPSRKNMAFRLAVYQHIISTGSFHVAQQGKRIVAFACAIVRGRQWFLAGFWARPAVQGKHIGATLLRAVWEEGRKAGATTYFVWSSQDLPAMAAYLKMGMLPGTQILGFEGTPSVRVMPPAAYTTQPLTPAVANGLDKVVYGARREMDHAFLARVGCKGTQVLRAGIGVGYYYLYEGVIGPAAWTHPRHSDVVLAFACAGQKQVSLSAPGMNHDAIQFALRSGLRLTGFSHLFTTSPFGHLDTYLPSGPYLF